MVASAINYRDLQRQIELDGPQRVTQFIREGLEQKWFRPQDFSLRRLAQSTIPDGREFVEACGPQGSQSTFMEAAGGMVDTAAFSNITGQIVYTKIAEGYEYPGFIWSQLCEVQQTEFSGEKIPEVGEIGDDTLRTNEGEEYHLLGLGQGYVETPETVKWGGIVPVTKEAIFFDRTNLVLKRASDVGYWAGMRREKEVISVVTGTTNNYARNGSTSDTYKTSAGHGIVNSATNALVDWTDLNEMYLIFDGMTDFHTSEPIMVLPDVLLVPSDLRATAHFILNSTQVRGGTSNATSHQVLSTDPVKSFMPLSILTSPMVYAVNSSTTAWYLGQPKRAFTLMENWGITTEVAPANSEWAFMRDIIQRYKVSERSVCAVMDPHYMCNSTGGG